MMETNPQRPAICTTYEILGDDGYRHYHSQQSLRAVEQQIRQVLATVRNADGQTAEELAEWIAWYTEDGGISHVDAEWPTGEVMASVRAGSSEGWIVYILVRPRGELGYKPSMAIKYLTDRDLVYEAAKALSIAFDEGLYESEAPPAPDQASAKAR